MSDGGMDSLVVSSRQLIYNKMYYLSTARSVEGQLSVSMGGSAQCARSAEGQASVSTGGSAITARSVEGQAPVSMDGGVVRARIVAE